MKPNASSPASVLASQIQHLVTLHETLLVKEFRTRQALLDLAQKEQKALARGDYPALDDLQAGKQSTLVELGYLEKVRAALIQGLSETLVQTIPSGCLAEPLSSLDHSASCRVECLQSGILALEGTTDELNKANQALLDLLP